MQICRNLSWARRNSEGADKKSADDDTGYAVCEQERNRDKDDLFPLFSMDINSPGSIIVNCLVFWLIGLLYVEGSMLYLNPMLILFRYHVIRIEDKVLITRKNIVELQQSIAVEKKIAVRKICDEIYIEEKVKKGNKHRICETGRSRP